MKFFFEKLSEYFNCKFKKTSSCTKGKISINTKDIQDPREIVKFSCRKYILHKWPNCKVLQIVEINNVEESLMIMK